MQIIKQYNVSFMNNLLSTKGEKPIELFRRPPMKDSVGFQT